MVFEKCPGKYVIFFVGLFADLEPCDVDDGEGDVHEPNLGINGHLLVGSVPKITVVDTD